MTDIPTATEAVATAGRAALAEADRLWALNIYDPAPSDATARGLFCKHTIESLIAACGWTWALPYLGHDKAASGTLEWCGLFAGACWVKAGLKPAIAKTWLASTYRIDAFGSYTALDAQHPNPRPTDGPLRMMATLNEHSTELPWQPQAGDILTIGPSGYGQHITVVDHYDAEHKLFYVVSGNGVGIGPDGKKMWGVVKSQVPLGGASWHACRLLRLAGTDLV